MLAFTFRSAQLPSVALLALLVFGCGKSDAECRGDTHGCGHLGKCAARGKICVPGGSGDCLQASSCKKLGRCTVSLDGTECVVGSDGDCASSAGCADDGQCLRIKDDCLAVHDSDCEKSTGCKMAGRCFANGRGMCSDTARVPSATATATQKPTAHSEPDTMAAECCCNYEYPNGPALIWHERDLCHTTPKHLAECGSQAKADCEGGDGVPIMSSAAEDEENATVEESGALDPSFVKSEAEKYIATHAKRILFACHPTVEVMNSATYEGFVTTPTGEIEVRYDISYEGFPPGTYYMRVNETFDQEWNWKALRIGRDTGPIKCGVFWEVVGDALRERGK